MTPSRTRDELVPLSDRLAVLQVLRVLIAFAAFGIGAVEGEPELALVPLVAAYLVATAVLEVLRRRAGIRALSAVSWMLLVDGLFLALAVALTGGSTSRLIPLVFFHVIAITLLVSYRTGLKLAVWYALLLFLGHLSVAAGVIGDHTGDDRDAVLSAVGLLLFAIGVAACSSVNERALRRSRTELRALVELGTALERVASTEELALLLAHHATQRLPFRRVAVMVRHHGRWNGAYQTGEEVVLVASDLEAGSLAERVWASETPALLRTLDECPVADRFLPFASNVVAVPLVADGEAMGIVLAEWGPRRHARVPALTVDTLDQSAGQTALALRNAWLLAEVEHLATRDGLTGLANRRLFEETLQREVARASRRGTPLALVVLDVDHFKDVNDTVGHQAGDVVLREVASVLVAKTKASDLAARYGGDEFVVLLPDCGADDAMGVAERLRAATNDGVAAVPVTLSAGVGAVPDNAGDGDRLVSAADAALYEAKREGRDRAVRSTRRPEPDEIPSHPAARRGPSEVIVDLTDAG